MIYYNTGNVGIGTSSPSDTLTVGNNFKVNGATGNITTAGALTVVGVSTLTGNTSIGGTLGVIGTTTMAVFQLGSSATVGQVLTADNSGVGTWKTPVTTAFANPTATTTLTATNGSATTTMRSDAAPALSQAIAPSWTGMHTFSNATYSALFTGGNVGIGTTTPNAKLVVAGDITAIGKMTASTYDPLYEINNNKYATFLPAMPGVREEYVGRGKLVKQNGKYQMVVDFSKVEKESDIWLWYQIIDFSSENVEVLMTPIAKPANLYFEIKNKKIIFKGNSDVEFSYRLTGRRFDWKKWPTKTADESAPGMRIKEK